MIEILVAALWIVAPLVMTANLGLLFKALYAAVLLAASWIIFLKG
mgnify:CR=1 FL=1